MKENGWRMKSTEKEFIIGKGEAGIKVSGRII